MFTNKSPEGWSLNKGQRAQGLAGSPAVRGAWKKERIRAKKETRVAPGQPGPGGTVGSVHQRTPWIPAHGGLGVLPWRRWASGHPRAAPPSRPRRVEESSRTGPPGLGFWSPLLAALCRLYPPLPHGLISFRLWGAAWCLAADLPTLSISPTSPMPSHKPHALPNPQGHHHPGNRVPWAL
jgi:hypothetical protein